MFTNIILSYDFTRRLSIPYDPYWRWSRATRRRCSHLFNTAVWRTHTVLRAGWLPLERTALETVNAPSRTGIRGYCGARYQVTLSGVAVAAFSFCTPVRIMQLLRTTRSPGRFFRTFPQKVPSANLLFHLPRPPLNVIESNYRNFLTHTNQNTPGPGR